MKQVLAAFAKNTVFANIVLVLIFIAGGLALSQMVRESFPEFSIDMISITVPYPGADPEEVEEGICQKIEEAIESVDGVKLFTTKAMEGAGSVTIEVKEGRDVAEVLDQVKSRVNAISTFPVDAEQPVIQEIIRKESVILLSLSGTVTEKQLKEWGERVKDELKQLPEVSQVDAYGTRSYEIGIELSEERLKEYGLTFSQVADAIRKSSLNLSGGTLRTTGEEIRIRTVGRKYTDEALAEVVIMADPGGDIVTLGRIAEIKDGFSEDPISAKINGQPAMFVMVYKTSEEDSIKISDAVNSYVEKKQNTLPPTVKLGVFYDNTDILRARIDLLTKNGVIGLCLVFIILWLFLDIRLSFWAGMGIPISITGAMFILWSVGSTINMISLFGMIMVLGIVVDDAIVVGEAIYVNRMSGNPPLKSAVEGVWEVAMPVLAAVTTTIVAFIPLAYVGGVMGKFISILPTVVIACLVISLVECLILLPAHLSNLPDPREKRRFRGPLGRIILWKNMVGDGLESFIEKRYMPFLSWVLNWRYVSLTTAIAILLISVGVVAGGFVKFQVVPKLDGFVITSTVEFPEGTPPEITREALEKMDAALVRVAEKTTTLSGEPLLKQRLTLLGQALSGTMGAKGPRLGSVQAILLESENRGIHSNDLLIEWEKELGQLPGVKSLTFEGMQAGPGGAEIEVWLQGRNMDDLIDVSEKLKTRLREFQGVYQIRSDHGQGKNEMRLELKPVARNLGITVEDLARQVNAGFYGREPYRLQRGSEDIRVKVRYSKKERSTVSDFEKMSIRTASGDEVPLLSVANISFSPGYATITRTDGMRRIVVTAEVNSVQANADEIFNELNKTTFPQLKAEYDDLFVSMQGAKKNSRESLGSLKIGFPVAILGIFVIVATIFRSYIQPFIILFTIPFGVIGAVCGHLLFGYDISMMSLFGIVALSGVVINSAIVLIERVNSNLASGMSLFKSVIFGGARRFRAIFLTSISTVGGLAPLILEKDMQAKFLIPMALSIAAGVIFATVLTLVLVPSLLVILNDIRRLIFRLHYGWWPKREEVEPRANSVEAG